MASDSSVIVKSVNISDANIFEREISSSFDIIFLHDEIMTNDVIKGERGPNKYLMANAVIVIITQ